MASRSAVTISCSPFRPSPRTSSRATPTAPQMPSCASSRRETRPPASKGSNSEDVARTRWDARAGRARLRAGRLRVGERSLPRQARLGRGDHHRARADRHAAVEPLARGLVLARQRARRRPAGPRADPARRDGGDERAARRPDRRGALGRPVERRAPGHAATRDRDPRRPRDGRPHLRVPVRRRRALDADAARPGRLHADPVPDRAEGALPPRRRAGQRLLERGHRAQPSGRPQRLRRPAAGDHGRQAGGRRPRLEPGHRLRDARTCSRPT